MSQENVELIRRVFDIFNRVGASGDLTELVQVQREFADPAIEYTPVVEGVRICGHEDLLGYWQRWFEPWDEIRWDIEEVIDAGEQVIAVLTIVARGKGSGMEITGRAFPVFDVRDGKIARVREHLMRDEALAAVGLSDEAG
jgi:ketosteroid isomerase-like protein